MLGVVTALKNLTAKSKCFGLFFACTVKINAMSSSFVMSNSSWTRNHPTERMNQLNSSTIKKISITSYSVVHNKKREKHFFTL